MSIFNELLPKINEISNAFTKNFNEDLKAVFDCFDKFEEEFQNGRGKAREKATKDKNPMTTLQSINEDEVTDESTKPSDTDIKRRSSNKSNTDLTTGRSSAESNTDKPQRASKKRSKNEVDGLSSPEQDKRQKRNASVKAQSIISKQVNVNLTQKLRREDTDKSRGRRRKDDEKENAEPLLNIQIKQEKVSLPPEPMDTESLLIGKDSLSINIEVKQEVDKDEIAMPPPVAPIPKPRKGVPKEKPDESSEEETTGKRRTTRTRKQTDTVPPPVASARSTRASSRSTRRTETEEPAPPPADSRPKRTRAKKKVSEVAAEPEKATTAPQENGLASPAEKPRPKRTRRGQKAAEKLEEKPQNITPPALPVQEPTISPKEERISLPVVSSPILQKDIPKKIAEKAKKDPIVVLTRTNLDDVDALDTTRVIEKTGEMDKTMVLPNGVYNHAPTTPKNVRNMNETMVLEPSNRETMVLDKPHNIMNATVVIDKDPKQVNITDDNSLLTDDSDSPDMHTPPKQEPPVLQPTSAVKEKVQQFEELASRVTRTKTRALAKKQEEQTETQTPPDKIVKPVLSAETLNKMNNMIFNGKPQISSSATKPRANVVSSTKSFIPSSTSKLSGINRAREAEELKKEREDARKKKEAMLEAKRELQKRKREEKMAAAAAAREAAERERRAAMEAAARERMEKQAHADLGKLERLKEAERKKQELARKVAETEERRKAEELARQQRLADEQRRADDARRKQLEEAAATKKEAAIMAKEIEKRQKEYIEKQKMKHRMEDKSHTPLKTPGTPGGWHGTALEPAYMADGFQYLNSDEDEEPVERPVPEWSTSKSRRQQLCVQSQVSSRHVDRLFSVRVHSPDLRDIFPNIERAQLKRTSSAVWRTPPPPARLPPLHE